MTIGIYLLGFKGTHKVYVGQSKDSIESRYTDHCRYLRRGTHTIKMNKAYESFGLPTLEIMEVLSYTNISSIDALENYHINLWNAVDDGFNTCNEAGDSPTPCNQPKGDNHGSSKYSNSKIIEVFLQLIKMPRLSLLEISCLTEVPLNVVGNISSGHSHTWLSEEFPDEYLKLLSTKGKVRGFKYPPVLSPEGNIFYIDNASIFAKEHGLNQGNLSSLLHGRKHITAGWRLANIAKEI